MWKRLRRAAACGVAAVAALGMLTPAALASTEAETRLYAPSALVLTVAKGENATESTPLRAVTLTCMPGPDGTHPAPKEACAALYDVQGEFSALRGDSERACVKIYDPVVVTAQGVWEGQRVDFQQTFGNACVLGNEGTSVFNF